jgi:predicted nucleic acid-binding protein
MSDSTVCIDASLAVALLIPERYSARALALWQTWIEGDLRILAPALLGYEVTSALYRKVLQNKIELKDGQAALERFLALGIESIHLPVLHIKASALAGQFERPNTYDAHYLAVADHFACPFWTADERLYNTVKDKLEWVKWIEEVNA